MEGHCNLSDSEFEKQFESCTLDPELFSHEAHLRLAWIHIRKYGLQQAIQNIETQLQNFLIPLGKLDKYHQTITIAAIKAVNFFMYRSKSNTFREFIEESLELKGNFRELINSHYKMDIFKSEMAKTQFIEPDIIPFED